MGTVPDRRRSAHTRRSERPPKQQVERALAVLGEPRRKIHGTERALRAEEEAAAELEAIELDIVASLPGVARLDREPEVCGELKETRAAAAHASEHDGARQPVLRSREGIAWQTGQLEKAAEGEKVIRRVELVVERGAAFDPEQQAVAATAPRALPGRREEIGIHGRAQDRKSVV